MTKREGLLKAAGGRALRAAAAAHLEELLRSGVALTWARRMTGQQFGVSETTVATWVERAAGDKISRQLLYRLTEEQA